jgi:hypothetical protein
LNRLLLGAFFFLSWVALARSVRFSVGDFPETKLTYRRFGLTISNPSTLTQTVTIALFNGAGAALPGTVWTIRRLTGATFVAVANGSLMPPGQSWFVTLRGDQSPSFGEVVVNETKGFLVAQGAVWGFEEDRLRASGCVAGCNACCSLGTGSFAVWDRTILVNGGKPF